MDNLMDKLLQKYYSQEMIRANTEGEKEERESLQKQTELWQKQMEQYDECLREMRKLNLRTIESTQELQQLIKTFGEGVGEITAASGEELQKLSAQAMAKMNGNLTQVAEVNDEKISLACDQMIELSTAKINLAANMGAEKVNALADDALAKIKEVEIQSRAIDFTELTEKLDEVQKSMADSKSEIEELFRKSEEFAHKDHVKVYRNVQAVVTDAVSKQTAELMEVGKQKKGKDMAVFVFIILIFLISAADLGLALARIFGLL